MQMSKLNKKWGNKKNSFELSVFKKRILKIGERIQFKNIMTLMTATRRTVTTSTMMTTTMTGMKVATTKLNITIKPDKQDKCSDIINVKIKESDKNSEAENDEVEDR